MLDHYLSCVHLDIDTPEDSTPDTSDDTVIDVCDYLDGYTIKRGNGYHAKCWSDTDLEQMCKDDYVVENPDPPVAIVPRTHTRVQVTQYKNGQYVKGQSDNFEIKEDCLKGRSEIETISY